MRSKRRSHDASNPDGGCSILHEDLARHRREAARTVVGDDDALGGLEAPVVEPQAGHEVEGRSDEHTSELQSLMRNSYAVFCLHKKNHNYCTPLHHTYD